MVHTATALAAAFNARYPSAQAGNVGSIAAAAAADSIGSIQAAAYRPYSAGNGKLVHVKALMAFYVPGAVYIPVGDFVQVTEREAADLIRGGRVELATDEEVAAAQKKAK